MAGTYTPKSGPFAGETFRSYRQYKNATARAKGFESYSVQSKVSRPQRSTPRIIGSAEKLAGLSTVEGEKRSRAFKAIALARRDNLSPSAAAKAAGTTLGTVKKYAGSALDKQGNRYVIKEYDHLSRHTTIPTPDGTLSVIVNDSRTASLLGEYWRAVDHYQATGDDSLLQNFKGKGVTIDK